jgi:hypothetical protein
MALVAEGVDGASRGGAHFGLDENLDSALGPAVSDGLWEVIRAAMAGAGWEITVDAYATESNRRAERYWSRYGELGSEAVDALSVGDWGRSMCPRCGRWHREVVYAFPPSGLIRQPTSDEVSAMVVRGLSHVGYDTSLFSGISARRGGIPTAIEAGLPEAILWMQSGPHDVAARRYMSPAQDVGGRPSASEDPPAPPEPHGALLLFCTSSAAVGGCSCLAHSESRDRIRSRDRPSSTAGSGPPWTGDVTQPGVLSGDGAWAGSGFYHSVFTL